MCQVNSFITFYYSAKVCEDKQGKEGMGTEAKISGLLAWMSAYITAVVFGKYIALCYVILSKTNFQFYYFLSSFMKVIIVLVCLCVYFPLAPLFRRFLAE
jgi:hypothetical protein